MNQSIVSDKVDPQSIGNITSGAVAVQDSAAAGAGGVAVGGNVGGDIIRGDYNLKVNTNYGTIVFKQAPPRTVKLRGKVPPPRPPLDFFDRANELAQLDQLIRSNKPVTVYGPEGVGKSTLLRQVANGDAARTLPHGVALVEGVDVDGKVLGPSDVVQSLFNTLYDSRPRLKVDASTARAYLGKTRPLVILDHVNLPSADSLRTLLDLFPHSPVLLASIQSPAGNFTRLVKLGPLPRAEAIELLASQLGAPVDEENRSALDALCALLADMPLAIVTAAHAIRENHIPLDRARAFLASVKPPSAEAMQAGIERAYALAYSTLSKNERQMLGTAASAPGISVDPQWLRQMMGDGAWVEPALVRLGAMGLLYANSPRLRVDPGLRDLARIGADEVSVKDRLIDYFKTALETQALDWDYCAAELGNILGTIDWAAGRRQWSEVISLGRAIDPYLTLHGLWEAWQAILDRVLQAARAIGDRAGEAWALHQLGTHAIGIGQAGQAIDFLRQALDLRSALGDTIGMAYTQHNLDQLLTSPPSNDGGHKPSVKPNGKPPILGGALKLLGMIMIIGAVAAGSYFLVASASVLLTCEQANTCTETPTSMPTNTSTPTLEDYASANEVAPTPTPAAISSNPVPDSTQTLTHMPTSSPTALPRTTLTAGPTAALQQITSTIAARQMPTPTDTRSSTPTSTPTPTRTHTPTPTRTLTPTYTPTISPTIMPSYTPTPTPTDTPTIMPSITPSDTPTPTLTPTPIDTVGPSITNLNASPTLVGQFTTLGCTVTFTADISDPSGVASAWVEWRNSASVAGTAPMSSGRVTWSATFTVTVPYSGTLNWGVRAFDTLSNPNTVSSRITISAVPGYYCP